MQLAPLDFGKIKAFLRTSKDESQLCATLQALRWRISRVNHIMRRQATTAYIHFNLLDVETFDALFHNQSIKVKEYFMSLVNNMASEYQGRSYLLQYPNIVALLITAMRREALDSFLRQNCLGTLQKFSLRK